MLNVALIECNNFIFIKKNRLPRVYIALLGSISIALSAQITIPFFPIPATLQTFAILLISALLGPKLGSKVVLLYLLEGTIGLPIFANFSCGLPIIFGPTGGYLIGFVCAAYLTGYLLQHGWSQNRLSIFMAVLLGDVMLFISGYLILSCFVGYYNAYLFGVAPFILLEFAKLLLLTLIIPPLLRKIKTT